MMNERILKWFLILCSLWLFSFQGFGQTTAKKGTTTPPEPEVAWFQGVYLSADLFGYIYPIFTSNDFSSSELAVSVNLKNRFLPTFEMGWGKSHKTSELYLIRYQTQAPYFRVGMDYNTQYKKGSKSYILAGARVGYSGFKYNVDGAALQDPVWGGSVPMQFNDLPCHAWWGELLVGVRAQIGGNLHMGWTIRYKRRLHMTTNVNGNPWYVPGFGIYNSETIGATYHVTYYFQFNNLRKK